MNVPCCLSGIVVVVASLLPTGSLAQSSCPFDESESIPDTRNASEYFPLNVGNVWEYTVKDGAFDGGPLRRHVVADTLVDGQQFFIVYTSFFETDGNGNIWKDGSAREYLSVQDGILVNWVNDDIVDSGIKLDNDFNECYSIESYPESVTVSGGYQSTFEIEEDDSMRTLNLSAIKSFEGAGVQEYGYSIGLLRQIGDPSVTATLVYFDVDEDQAGTPLDSMYRVTTSIDRDHENPAFDAAGLVVYPNPAQANVTSTISLVRPAVLTNRFRFTWTFATRTCTGPVSSRRRQ